MHEVMFVYHHGILACTKHHQKHDSIFVSRLWYAQMQSTVHQSTLIRDSTRSITDCHSMLLNYFLPYCCWALDPPSAKNAHIIWWWLIDEIPGTWALRLHCETWAKWRHLTYVSRMPMGRILLPGFGVEWVFLKPFPRSTSWTSNKKEFSLAQKRRANRIQKQITCNIHGRAVADIPFAMKLRVIQTDAEAACATFSDDDLCEQTKRCHHSRR
jgi:hypothetical protein